MEPTAVRDRVEGPCDNPLLVPDLRELIHDGEIAGLRDFFAEHHPGRVAELMDDLETQRCRRALRRPAPAQPRRGPELPRKGPPGQLVKAMPPKDAAELLHLMSHDERADLVNRLDEDVVDPVLPFLAQAEREDIRRLASYEPGTAGAAMTTDYVALPPHITVREALELLRHEAPDRETIYYCYVVDHKRRLIGFVSLKRLILSRRSAVIEDIMQRDIILARVDEDQESVARQIDKYDLLAIPVVDASDMLLGIITHDDAMDILRQEQTEDILAFGGVSRDAEANEETYWQGRIVEGVRRRIGWLLFLFLAGTMTKYVSHFFKGVQLRASRPDRLHPAPDRHRRQRRQPDRRHDHPRPGAGRDPGLARLPRRLSRVAHRPAPGNAPGRRSASSTPGHCTATRPSRPSSAWRSCSSACGPTASGAVVPLLAKRFGIDPAVVSAPLISTAGRCHRPGDLLHRRHRAADQVGGAGAN